MGAPTPEQSLRIPRRVQAEEAKEQQDLTGNIIISSNDEPDEPDEPGHLPKKGTAFRQFQIRGSEHLPKGEPEHLW